MVNGEGARDAIIALGEGARGAIVAHVLTPSPGWSARSFVPLLANAGGGIVVGFVVKYAGSVQKGLATALGIALTGLFSWAFNGEVLSTHSLVALPIVIGAMALYIDATRSRRAKARANA